MIAVLVAANEQDKDFLRDTALLLEKYFAIVRVIGRTLIVAKKEPSLIICDMQSFDAVKAERSIVLFKEAVPMTANLSRVGQTVAVVDSSNGKLTEYVGSTGLPAITCGLLGWETITLSSMDVDSAVISIQRSITCFDGSKTEPQDIPVRFAKPVDNFALMAVATVLILSGNTKMLQKGKM